MKEETITKYIDQLAQSLNVASEHVYEALIKQAMVSGIASIVWAVLFLITIIGLIIGTIKVFKWNIEEDDGDMLIPFGLLMAVMAIIPVLGLLFNVENALTALLNPEYWAIKEVLSAIKS